MTTTGLLLDHTEHVFSRVPLQAVGGRDEKWLQDLLFRHPDLIPIQELDPGASPLVPICRELALPKEGGSVFLDLLCLTRHGRPVLIECKLWRNPQARREVIGQILEYAALLRTWSYGDLSARLKEKLGWRGENPLFEHVRRHEPALQEAGFVDSLSRCLLTGDFDLVIAGDGIRTDLQAIAGHLNSYTGQLSRLALVEIQLWMDVAGRTLVMPSMPFRTQVIEHRVLTDQQGMPLQVVPPSEDDDAAVAAVVEPEKVLRQDQDRAFWQRFIDEVRFDHPDQPAPRHAGRNWVRMDMPSPARWLTAYRTGKGGTGFFLPLSGEAGEKGFRFLRSEGADLEKEVGLPLRFEIRTQEPFSGQVLMERDRMAGDEGSQLAWLCEAGNRLVTALRPRLAATEAAVL